jgi:hypothetical protein
MSDPNGIANSGMPLALIGPNRPRFGFWDSCKCLKRMAGTTGLELATSAVAALREQVLQELT